MAPLQVPNGSFSQFGPIWRPMAPPYGHSGPGKWSQHITLDVPSPDPTLIHTDPPVCSRQGGVWHPLLKGGYTGHEKTYSGDVDISPGLAETKRNQQFLDKSVLPIFLGSSYFPQINTKTGYFGHILNLTVPCKVFIRAVLMENM